jgi:hypothetical protein
MHSRNNFLMNCTVPQGSSQPLTGQTLHVGGKDFNIGAAKLALREKLPHKEESFRNALDFEMF